MLKPVIYLTKSDLACSQDRTTSFEFILTNFLEFFNQSDEVLFVHLMGRFFSSKQYWLQNSSTLNSDQLIWFYSVLE